MIKHLHFGHIEAIALSIDEDIYGANGNLSGREKPNA